MSILDGKTTLAVLPTGFWKSICFQIPAVIKEWITLVITPLISLMEDQVSSFNEKDDLELLKEKWIAAVFINSSLSVEDKKRIYAGMFDNQYKLIYITPERFVAEWFAEFVSKFDIAQVVIDEVHCIQTYWKSDFRKAYLELWKTIKALKKKQPLITVSAFSWTVSARTLKSIEEVLWFEFETKVVWKAYKENISLITKFYDTKKMALKKVKEMCLSLDWIEWKILIFWGTIKDTRELSRSLKTLWLNASYYYAGLAPATKTTLLKNYKAWKIKFLCATSAFGMWVDIPDIRAVIHFCIPTDAESYVQEIWRAGRDGKDSVAILLWSKKDVVVSRSMLFWRTSYFEDKNKLEEFVEFVKDEDNCKIWRIADFFWNEYEGTCGKCSSCLTKELK
jgi:ATP-dependent DNA helicase RecQ